MAQKMRPGKNGGKLKTGGTHPNAGRPPDLKKLIWKILAEERKGGNGLELVIRSLLAKAVNKGDVRAAQELLDRLFGKVPQQVSETENKTQQWPTNITFQVHEPKKEDE